MNRKMTDGQGHARQDIEQQKNGEYAMGHSRTATVIAAVVCVLLALVVWVVIMGTEDSDYVAVRMLNVKDEYTYTVSVDFLEVEGTVGALRHAGYIGVRIPEDAVAGVYQLTVDDLVLPDGVHLTAEPDITLTVRSK